VVVLPGALRNADASSGASSIRHPDRHRVDSVNWFCSPRLHDQEVDHHLARDFHNTLDILAAGWFPSDHRREFFPEDYSNKFYPRNNLLRQPRYQASYVLCLPHAISLLEETNFLINILREKPPLQA